MQRFNRARASKTESMLSPPAHIPALSPSGSCGFAQGGGPGGAQPAEGNEFANESKTRHWGPLRSNSGYVPGTSPLCAVYMGGMMAL